MNALKSMSDKTLLSTHLDALMPTMRDIVAGIGEPGPSVKQAFHRH